MYLRVPASECIASTLLCERAITAEVALLRVPFLNLKCCALRSLATQLNDYTLTFNQDPVAVLTNETALVEFKSKLQNQLAGFFDVAPAQVCARGACEGQPRACA